MVRREVLVAAKLYLEAEKEAVSLKCFGGQRSARMRTRLAFWHPSSLIQWADLSLATTHASYQMHLQCQQGCAQCDRGHVDSPPQNNSLPRSTGDGGGGRRLRLPDWMQRVQKRYNWRIPYPDSPPAGQQKQCYINRKAVFINYTLSNQWVPGNSLISLCTSLPVKDVKHVQHELQRRRLCTTLLVQVFPCST